MYACLEEDSSGSFLCHEMKKRTSHRSPFGRTVKRGLLFRAFNNFATDCALNNALYRLAATLQCVSEALHAGDLLTTRLLAACTYTVQNFRVVSALNPVFLLLSLKADLCKTLCLAKTQESIAGFCGAGSGRCFRRVLCSEAQGRCGNHGCGGEDGEEPFHTKERRKYENSVPGCVQCCIAQFLVS